MMEDEDRVILGEMRNALETHSGDDLMRLSERLLLFRDRLVFSDEVWYDDLTQNVATLDSASTFHPANDEERRQLDVAIRDALDRINRLISTKIG